VVQTVDEEDAGQVEHDPSREEHCVVDTGDMGILLHRQLPFRLVEVARLILKVINLRAGDRQLDVEGEL